MNIIVWTKRGGSYQLNLGNPRHMLLVTGTLLLILAALFTAAFQTASLLLVESPDERVQRLEAELEEQREETEAAMALADERMHGLSVRMGQMQAEVVRLNALGERLTDMSGLDEGEFNFREPPARGGPEILPMEGNSGNYSPREFLEALESLEGEISDRTRQLGVLEKMLMNRNVQERVEPQGRPIEGGWVSSGYGNREDPFTGQPAWHGGMDFAGRKGTEVSAVGAGVVTWSGDRYGYGKMVEINHGNGYSTRYAHNQENLVEVGDMVREGETIALLGASGRATGPHVHFEVLYNGRTVDPGEYIRRRD